MRRAFMVSLVIFLLLSGCADSGIGPTGEELPPHIISVKPADGEAVAESQGFCANFRFQEGHGMGRPASEKIQLYLNDNDVTDKLDGLVTMDYSLGVICYKRGASLLPGWHTAAIVYTDLEDSRFQYRWRFRVEE